MSKNRTWDKDPKNRERIQKAKREWYYRNRETVSINSKEYRKKHWDYALYKAALDRSRKFNIPFLIEQKDIIIPKFCPILGLELKPAEGRMNDASPTLDRINPNLGYIKGNICVMSNRANRIKSDGTIEEHEKIIQFLRQLTN